MDCGPRRYLAAISLRGKSNNLESRIERVSGMYFLEKLAGDLGKRDEHVSDVLRKERCSGSREREYLQGGAYRGCVSVTPRIPHVIVNRMIVSRNSLEGRGVRIGERAAWCAEDFANAQVFKCSRRYNGEVAGAKGVRGFGYICVRFMFASFSLLFFEGWSVVESGADAKLFFGRLMAATTAAAPRIILRRDKQLDPSSVSGDIAVPASFVCVGMFIEISFVSLGSEIECLQITSWPFSKAASSSCTAQSPSSSLESSVSFLRHSNLTDCGKQRAIPDSRSSA